MLKGIPRHEHRSAVRASFNRHRGTMSERRSRWNMTHGPRPSPPFFPHRCDLAAKPLPGGALRTSAIGSLQAEKPPPVASPSTSTRCTASTASSSSC